MTRTDNILVLCVDRDNDIGNKANIKGPIIGRSKNIDTAVKLALADPSESDVNAIFHAVKSYDQLKKDLGSTVNVDIVTVTGGYPVGIISDKIIEKQLDELTKKIKYNKVVFVSDGQADEHIMPIIKHKLGTFNIYTERVIIKQNRYLEGAYYIIYDFISAVASNKDLSKIFFGIPAIMLILYAIFGFAGGRLILGVVGIYLLVRGFHLDPYVMGFISEFSNSAKLRKASFFVYIASITFLIMGVIEGYSSSRGIIAEDMLLAISLFLHASIFLLFFSAILLGIGVLLRDIKAKTNYLKYLSYFVLIFAISWIIYALTSYVINAFTGIGNVLYTLLISGGLTFIVLSLERTEED
ncbi:MAG: DUF373 family protein [DPANN group archaeon]|nr:DUF373 family protein [DPANN group archaeon]